MEWMLRFPRSPGLDSSSPFSVSISSCQSRWKASRNPRGHIPSNPSSSFFHFPQVQLHSQIINSKLLLQNNHDIFWFFWTQRWDQNLMSVVWSLRYCVLIFSSTNLLVCLMKKVFCAFWKESVYPTNGNDWQFDFLNFTSQPERWLPVRVSGEHGRTSDHLSGDHPVQAEISEAAQMRSPSSWRLQVWKPCLDCVPALETLRDIQAGIRGSRLSYGITRSLDIKIRCLLALSTFLGLLGR